MRLDDRLERARVVAAEWAGAEHRFQAEVDSRPPSPESGFIRLALRLAKARRYAADAHVRELRAEAAHMSELRALLTGPPPLAPSPREMARQLAEKQNAKVRIFTSFDEEERTAIGAPAYLEDIEG